MTSWTQYGADVLLALTLPRSSGRRACSGRMRALLTVIPALDVAGAVLAYLGLDRLGAGPFTFWFSTILLSTALLSRLLLGKRLSAAQLAGIALVSAGLAARSLLAGPGGGAEDRSGVALTVLSTLSYALRTVAMEALRQARDAPSAGEVSAAIGRWGLAALTTWQLVYTVPRRDVLVSTDALALATKTTVAAYHLAFVASRIAFVLAQNSALAVAGANGVALVTAVRSVVVALASAALFCHVRPSQCLSPESVRPAACIA